MNHRAAPVFAPIIGLLSILIPMARAETPAPPQPGLPLPAEPAEPAPDYVRYHAATDPAAADATDRLQTALVRFEKNGIVVDLVAVVHLADAAYFKSLNERLKVYDVVLYEMVGGPHQGTDPAGTSAAEEEVGAVRQLQKMAKSFLGLQYQLEGIDYTAPNFVHADVAWDEMGELMSSRDESLMTLFTRASEMAKQGGVAGVPTDAAETEVMMKRIFQSIMSGDSGGLKRTVAPFLSEAESFITQIEGDQGSVLVSERNRVVMEKLAKLQQDRGRGSYTIFYGAGHMPDFEKRLLEQGFRKSDPIWLDAWSMPLHQTTVGAMSQVSPAEMMLKLLSENPEVMTGLQELGSALEDLGGKLKSIEPAPGQ